MIAAHTDVVGSLLRPVALRKARDDWVAGRLSHAQFKSIEDRAVDEAVSLQEAAGLDIVTDGEMRRLSFQSQMTEAVDGFGAWDINAFLWGHWRGDSAVGERRRDRPVNLGVVSRLVRKRHLAADLSTRPHKPRRKGNPAQPQPVREFLVAGTFPIRLCKP
jgi:5-methyltetrahydropteroyltriglutamate--homocysteine methyltransferase